MPGIGDCERSAVEGTKLDKTYELIIVVLHRKGLTLIRMKTPLVGTKVTLLVRINIGFTAAS